MNLKALRKVVDDKVRQYELACMNEKQSKVDLNDCEARHALILEASVLIQDVAAEVQKTVHAKIASVVSRCLESVFDDPYEFGINFDKKRGKTEANLYFIRGGRRLSPGAVGGGVVDVAAFALRLACLVMTRPLLRRVLLLDEPFRHLSGNFRDKAARLLESLADEMNVQIIMVTHDVEFQVGNVIEIKK